MKSFPRTSHLYLYILRAWHRVEAVTMQIHWDDIGCPNRLQKARQRRANSDCDWQLTLLSQSHSVFILSHSPHCPAKETSALLAPPIHQLCSLNGRCFPAQRNREHIAGNEGGGESHLPPLALSDPALESRTLGCDGTGGRSELVGKTKWKVNRIQWFCHSN